MAVNVELNATYLPDDETAEEALERASAAFRAARARLDTVDVARLSPMQRAEYYRLLTRIGLWVDAKMAGEGDEDDGTVLIPDGD